MSIENQIKQSMQQALEHLKQELKSLRTSRANPSMLDGVHVEVYGTKMRLKDMANISVPEARQLLVTPFDPSTIHMVAKGIEAANLNLHPKVDGNLIRINIPPMDEAVRKDIVKLCKKKAEEAKVSIREVRRKGNEQIRKQKADGLISEDMMKKQEKIVQDLTDKFCKDIDTFCADKEKEILAI